MDSQRRNLDGTSNFLLSPDFFIELALNHYINTIKFFFCQMCIAILVYFDSVLERFLVIFHKIGKNLRN